MIWTKTVCSERGRKINAMEKKWLTLPFGGLTHERMKHLMQEKSSGDKEEDHTLEAFLIKTIYSAMKEVNHKKIN